MHVLFHKEPWVKNPKAAVPEKRVHSITTMELENVKKEMEHHAELIRSHRSKSDAVKEHAHGGWFSRVPAAMLEELTSLTGWQRSEQPQGFIIAMPENFDDLVLPDEFPATCFLSLWLMSMLVVLFQISSPPPGVSDVLWDAEVDDMI